MVRARPLILDTGACDGCGRCVRVCPHNALKVGSGYIYVDWERCDGCGRCADVCDRGAIEVRETAGGLPPRVVALRPAVAPEVEGGVRGFLRGLRHGSAKSGTAAVADVIPVDGPIGAAWSTGEAVAVVLIGLVLFIALQAVLGMRDVRAMDAGSRMLVRAGALFGYYALQLAVLAFLAHRKGGGFFAAFGLRRPKLVMSVLMTFAALLSVWSFSLLYRAIALQLGWSPPVSDSPSLTVLFGSDATGLLLTVLMVVLVGPFVEELLFRGVLLTALDERLGGVVAILLSAPVFAMLHGSLWSFVPLTFLGIALGWLTVSRRSLWPAVVLHAAYNGVLVAAAFWVAARGF